MPFVFQTLEVGRLNHRKYSRNSESCKKLLDGSPSQITK